MSGRLTYSENGKFGVTGINLSTLDAKLYMCVCKLKDYENSGLMPDQVIALQDKVNDLTAEVERLQQWVDDLQSGMYVNCVYCGHRYGPADKVPVTMADALKEHIEQCSRHPMSALKKEVERLRANALPDPVPESDYDGLKLKYRVYKARNNEPVEGCFVLRPEKDAAARAALHAYADHEDCPHQLAQDIIEGLCELAVDAIRKWGEESYGEGKGGCT